MAQSNRGFAISKMNKDSDERTVKSGEYRDALNIQISSSDGSDVGSAQTLLGNVLMSSGMVPSGSFCVGVIAHDKEDKIYYLVAGPEFGYGDAFGEGVWKDYIIEYDAQTETFKYVFVDIYRVHLKTNTPSVGREQFVNATGNSLSVVRKEMIVNGYDSTNAHIIISDNNQEVEVTDVSSLVSIKIYGDTVDYSTTVVPSGTLLQCTSRRLLNFHGAQSGGTPRYITGINIIDDMLLWTDNHSEPKKINIPRSIAGTGGAIVLPASTNTIFTGDNADYHTRLCITPDKHHGLRVKRRNLTQPWYMGEENVTVIKKSPRTPPRLVMSQHEDGRDADTFTALPSQVSGPPGTNSFSKIVGTTTIVKNTGDTITLIMPTPVHFEVDDIILFNQQQEINSAEGFTEHDVRAIVTSAPGGASIGPYVFTIQSIYREDIDEEPKLWNVRLEERKPMFEFKFVRFAYRYKYEDGEYSTYSPWSEPAFLPGEYDYLAKKGFNLGMTNRLRELKIANYITEDSERPQDVIQVDLLYKDESSPNIYTVESIKLTDGWTLKGEYLWPDILNNGANIVPSMRARGEYKVTTELIHATVPSNQLLRQWDNVPRKALAQTISGNRLIYGNYLENFDLTTTNAFSPEKEIKPIINVTLHSVDAPLNAPPGTSNDPLNGEDTLEGFATPGKTCRSLRTYQVGVVYGDEYGRETPVLAGESGSGSITIDKENSSTLNKLKIDIATNPPSFAHYYKFFIKETSNEYYNMAMDRWYDAEDGNIWLSFASADRNKVDEETFIILKKKHDTHEPVTDPARYKVLAIENSAPPFIAENNKVLGKVTGTFGTSAIGFPLEDFSEIRFNTSITGWGDLNAGSAEGSSDLQAKVHAGTLWMRARTLTVFSDWYQVSNYKKSISSEQKFKSDKPFGKDMAFTSSDGTWAGKIGGVSVEFADRKVERKKEFEGRFFVKIFKDLVLFNNLLTTTTPSYRVTSATRMYYFNMPKARFDGPPSLVDWERVAMNLKGELNADGGIGTHTFCAATGSNNDDDSELFFKTANNSYQDGVPFLNPTTGAYTSCSRQKGTAIWHKNSKGRFHIDAKFVRGAKDCSCANAFGGTTGCGSVNCCCDDDCMDQDCSAFPGCSRGRGIHNSGTPSLGGLSMDIGYIGMDKTPKSTTAFEAGEFFRNTDHKDWINLMLVEGTNFRFKEDKDGIVYKVTGSAGATSGQARYGMHHTWDESTSELQGNNMRRWRVDFERQDQPGVGFGTGLSGYHILGGKDYTKIDPGFPNSRELGYWGGRHGAANWQVNGNSGSPTAMEVPMPYGYAPSKQSGTAIDTSTTLDKDGVALTVTPDVQACRWREHASKYHHIEIVEPIEDEDSDWSSKNPAVWETEPKEDVGMDIYYEASPALPVRINYKTNEMWAPYGSQVIESPTGGPSVPAGTYIVSWSDNVITLNNPVTPAAGSRFAFRRPDGFITSAIVNEIGPTTILTLRSIPVPPAPINNNSDAPHNQPTVLSWYNAFAFGNGIESDRIRDDYNQKTISNGVKASTVLAEQYSENRRKTGLISSGIYNSTSNVNRLNQFIQAEKITKDLNPSFSSIQVLHSRDTNIVALCEDKCIKVLADKSILYNADGKGDVGKSGDFFGNATEFATDYGISTNPESFATDLSGRLYFSDRSRSAVLRLSGDGITNISNYGMKDWFNDHLNSHTESVLGSFDTKKGLYNISIAGFTTTEISDGDEDGYEDEDEAIGGGECGCSSATATTTSTSAKSDGSDSSSTSTSSEDDGKYIEFEKTLSFSENSKGWTSFKSFLPDCGVSINNNYYTFKLGDMYKHHANSTRNFFYGQQYDSSLDVIFNDSPEAVKSFATLNYEGSQARVTPWTSMLQSDGEYHNLTAKAGWYVDSAVTDLQSCDSLEFKNKEGKWFSHMKGNTTNLNNLDEMEFSVQGIGVIGGVVTSDPDAKAGEACLTILPVTSCGDVYGCMDATATNYNPNATIDDGSCISPGIPGCTDRFAINFDPNATVDDGSCIWCIYGCMTGTLTEGMQVNSNYNPDATCDDGSCIPCIYGCMNNLSTNYDPTATCHDYDMCGFLWGCMDASAFNYNSFANIDDGSCVYTGCTDPAASNYDPNATIDDGSCAYGTVSGCTDPLACNYDATATVDDGTCKDAGCMDPIALNWDVNAQCDDGSCVYTVAMPPGDCAGDEYARTDDADWGYTTTYGSEPAEILMSHPNFGLMTVNGSGIWVRIVHNPPNTAVEEKWQKMMAWYIKIEVGGTYSDDVAYAFAVEFSSYFFSTTSTGGFTTVLGISFGATTYTELTWGHSQFDTYINKLNSFQDDSGNDMFNPPLVVGTDWSETVWGRIATLADGNTMFGYATTECCNYNVGDGDWQPGSCK